MIYSIIKWITWAAIRVFFGKIYFKNGKTIKGGAPTILAINHPTAFIDPLFIATNIRPKTHTMLRGDMFKTPLASWFLTKIGTIPIFRFRNGFSGLRQNQDTFDRCYEILNDNGFISIMCEGSMAHEKRLRTVQKGTAKMAFGTYEKFGNKDLQIIPIGVNYTDSNEFRSTIMASVGTPIKISDYMEAYQENPRKAILQITRNIQTQLEKRIVHIANPADDQLANRLLDIQRNNIETSIFPTHKDSDDLLQKEMALVQKLNSLSDDKKATLQEMVNTYFDQLANKNITDKGVAQPDHTGITTTLALILGVPIFILGSLTNTIPFYFGKSVATAKVKQIEFFSSLRLGVYLGVYTLQYLILLIAATILGNPFFWAFVFFTPFLGYMAVLYQDQLSLWQQARSVKARDRERLMQQREVLLGSLS